MKDGVGRGSVYVGGWVRCGCGYCGMGKCDVQSHLAITSQLITVDGFRDRLLDKGVFLGMLD